MPIRRTSVAARYKYDALTIDGALRALRTLAAANQALVRSRSESEFLQAVCEIAVEIGGYVMAWVGLAENDAQKLIRPIAQCSHETGYRVAANLSWADTERGRGPAGRAIRTRQIQVNQNIAPGPLTAQQRKANLVRRFQACIGLPLQGDAGPFGALTIYAREPDAFGEGEAALLAELAGDIAFGMLALRAKAEREGRVERIRQYDLRFRQSMEETIDAVCAALKAHDEQTPGHQKRVAALAFAIANEMGLPEDEAYGVKVAALVHDIGNLNVPAEILSKTAALSEIEFSIVQEHSQAGHEMLKDITFPWAIADMVWQHHERLDGTGYPRGPQGDEILLGAQIVGVADVVEAMASERPYRNEFSMGPALDEIRRGRALAFHPAVVDACMDLCRSNRFVFPQTVH